MSKINKSVLLASTALSLALGAPAAVRAADSVVAAGQEKIEEVVVTAQRREERLQDVPISITVYNQQQLANHNVYNASDLSRYTPSLSTDTRFGPDNSSFAIRGFTQEIRTTASVGVFFADVVAPRGGGIGTTAGDGAGPGDFFDLQNVQVLKGPQGTLFGRNTTGGDVLLVPQKPTDEFGGYFQAGAGNYGMQRTQGVLNLPVSDNVRLRFGYDEQTRDGYEHNISGFGPSTFANVDYYALRASADVDIMTNLENYTIATFSRSANHGALNQLFACNPKLGAAAVPFGQFLDLPSFGSDGPCAQVKAQEGRGYWVVDNNFPNPESVNQEWQIINTTTWRESDSLTIKNIASYSQFKSDLAENVFGDNLGANLGNIFPALKGSHFYLADSNLLPGYNSNDQYTSTEELQFQGNALDNNLIWQAGGYFEVSGPVAPSGENAASVASCTNFNTVPVTCINSVVDLVGLPPKGVSWGGGQAGTGTIDYHNLAGYGQATYSITDQLKLTGGIRFTSDLTHGSATDITYNPPPTNTSSTMLVQSCSNAAANPKTCTLEARAHSKAPTWVIDLDYTPIDGVMTYAKYSRGYRQGGVNPLGPDGFNTFNPERVDTYEVGAKTSFDGPVPGSFDFAAFYNDFSNQQLQVGFAPKQLGSGGLYNFASSASTGIVNEGKSHISGVEVDSSFFPFGDNFRLDLSGTYLASKLISEKTPTVPAADFLSPVQTDAVGGPLNLTPTWKTSITASYVLPVPEDLGKVTLGATDVYTDRMHTASPTETPFFFVKSSVLLNLFVNWDSIKGSQFSASFFMTNAMDYKYETFISGVYDPYGLESRSLGEPRMFGFQVRYDFGQ